MRSHGQKRGFTLMELLVVIAILAVLTTVTVVGYTSLVDRAKRSKDAVLLEQCNTVLRICAVYEGPNRTMTEALSDLSANGIELADLKASAKNCDIVWERSSDRFLLMREGAVLYPNTEASVNLSDCFLTVHSAEELQSAYSVHLAEDFAASAALCLNNVGMDDGGNAVSFSLSGDTADTLLLHTVGGSATVNLPNGTVEHYGSAEQVTVENTSYHVYGQIDALVLRSGQLVLEAGATVRELYIYGGSVLCCKGATVTVSAANAASIENKGGTVLLLPTESDEPNASDEPEEPDEPIAPNEPTASAMFAGGDGSREHPYLISTPRQFANIAALMEENYEEYEETIAVPYLEEKRIYSADYKLKEGFCRIKSVISAPCKEPGEHDFEEMPVDERRTVQQVCEEHDLDLEALGQYGLKYVIAEDSGGRVDCLIFYELREAKLTETLSRGKQYYYFRLTASIELPDDYSAISAFYGELDGDGYTLFAPEKGTGREQTCLIFEEALGGSVFRNFTFCLSQQPYSLVGGDGHRTNGTLQFEDITVCSREESCVQVMQDGFGALTRYAMHSWNAQLIVKNCVNRADFDFHDSKSAVFVGERYLELYPGDREIYDNSTASFVSCTNYGTLSGTAYRIWCVGIVSVDDGPIDETSAWLTVDACTEQGTPSA